MLTRIAVDKTERKRDNSVSRIRKTDNAKSLSSPSDILFIQRTSRNQAAQQLIKSDLFQANLRIGRANNIYEQEADRIAEQVMCNPQQVPQRQTDLWEADEEEAIHVTNLPGHALATTTGIHVSISKIRGRGQPLDTETRAFMEPRLGHNFADVRIHTDRQATEIAREINARAFTVGSDIVFGTGRYMPTTNEGRRLLAHELTHVIQQAGKAKLLTNITAEPIQRAPEEQEGTFPFSGMPTTCKRSSIKESPSGPEVRTKYRVRVCTDTNELFIEDLKPPHKQRFHTLVVTGGEKTPTPKGRFHLYQWEKDYTTPRWKEKSCTPWSKDPFGRNVFGPYIIRFKGGYFIHGTVGPGISPITLNGIAMGNLSGSHGCIRMANNDLKTLHDGLLSNPRGVLLIVTTCGTPAEADVEVVPKLTFSLGDENKPGFDSEFRLFLPTLVKRRLQPFIYTGIGTEGLTGGLGTSVDPFADLSLFLAGKIGIRTEWFTSLELGGGAEAGWAFGKSRSLRLGIGWEAWQQLDQNGKRKHLLHFFLGSRF